MHYGRELRTHWRAVAAATIGLSSALTINTYVSSLFAPYLIGDLGWSRAQFALIGMTAILILAIIPIVGRMTDLYGTRRVALIGVVAYPLSLLAFSRMPGSFSIFVLISVVQIILCSTTTTTVYCRLIAERVRSARGLALALAAMGPALVGGLGSPFLARFIETHGWRAGYQVLALVSALAGLVTLALAPSSRKLARGAPRAPRSARRDYKAILRTRSFRILAAGSFLCNLPQTLATSQLSVMLQDHALGSVYNGLSISIFAGGVIAGRMTLGLALDRFPTYAVATLGMGVSGVGMLLLAAPVDTFPLIALGVGLMGISFGAEADILAYAASRYFPIEIYSTVLSLLVAVCGLAAAIGAALLSLALKTTGRFQPFMIAVGLIVIGGSLLFLRLRRVESTQPPAEAEPALADA